MERLSDITSKCEIRAFVQIRACISPPDLVCVSEVTVEPPDTTCAILARLDQGGTADQFSTANLRAATLGGGMSQSQWNTFRTDWDNFENTLGRKVP